MILNYLRLRHSGQLWEACLPKDPDRLALLTQEAEFFNLDELREQAIALLHSCKSHGDTSYVDEVSAHLSFTRIERVRDRNRKS